MRLRAVEGHEGAGRSAAHGVESARDELLARPALAGDEDALVGGPGAPDARAQGRELRARPRHAEVALDDRGAVAGRGALARGVLEERQERRRVDRLLDERSRPEAHRFDRRGDGPVAGDHDDARARAPRAAQHGEPVAVAELQIEQRDVEAPGEQRLDGHLAAIGLLDGETEAPERLAHGGAEGADRRPR